jgi:ethanolamine utilization cobalamin adenosyltransferase
MLILDYASKKDLKECIGQPLRYIETSMFGPEYRDTGSLVGCNRPHMTGHKREFFAEVFMKDGLINKVK